MSTKTPKYAIVYANQFRTMRGDTVTTGQTVVTASDLDEVRRIVHNVIESQTDILTVIDLKTGQEIAV